MEAGPEVTTLILVNDAGSKTLGFAPRGPCFVSSFRVCLNERTSYSVHGLGFTSKAPARPRGGGGRYVLSRYQYRNVSLVVVLIPGGGYLVCRRSFFRLLA